MSLNRSHALVVYESMFGNSADIATAIAEGLEAAGMRVELAEVASAPPELDRDLDLLVVGAPTHGFSMSRPSTRAEAVRQGAPAERAGVGLREWLTSVAVDEHHAPGVSTFDTRATKVRWLGAAAAASAAHLARKRGLRVVSHPTGFLVTDVHGPLEPHEVERARAWGHRLAEALAVRPAEAG